MHQSVRGSAARMQCRSACRKPNPLETCRVLRSDLWTRLRHSGWQNSCHVIPAVHGKRLRSGGRVECWPRVQWPWQVDVTHHAPRAGTGLGLLVTLRPLNKSVQERQGGPLAQTAPDLVCSRKITSLAVAHAVPATSNTHVRRPYLGAHTALNAGMETTQSTLITALSSMQ